MNTLTDHRLMQWCQAILIAAFEQLKVAVVVYPRYGSLVFTLTKAFRLICGPLASYER